MVQKIICGWLNGEGNSSVDVSLVDIIRFNIIQLFFSNLLTTLTWALITYTLFMLPS